MLVLFFAALFAVAAPAPEPLPTLSPQQYLGAIRYQFRSHRPPPPYVTYTLQRFQLAENGFTDYVNSYTVHVWCRNSDRAALGRTVFRDTARGPLEFMRPAFNEARDPGPPTADVFEPAPIVPRPVEFVPTPEPAQSVPPVIGTVRTIQDYDYKADSAAIEGNLVHLQISPIRDPERNRLREIWADKNTYELKKLVAGDKLFVGGRQTYRTTFTITMGMLDGRPVVTDIHGKVGDNYVGDGVDIDYHFREITFPETLPAWYFDKRSYGAHASDAPL